MKSAEKTMSAAPTALPGGLRTGTVLQGERGNESGGNSDENGFDKGAVPESEQEGNCGVQPEQIPKEEVLLGFGFSNRKGLGNPTRLGFLRLIRGFTRLTHLMTPCFFKRDREETARIERKVSSLQRDCRRKPGKT